MMRLAGATAVLISIAGSLGAQQGPPPAPVTVVEAVQTEMISRVLVPGTVTSRSDARIAAEGAGQLIWVAEVGEVVTRGEAVARIDDSALRLQLRNDEAQIRRLEADLAFFSQQVERRRRLAQEQIISANDLEESEAQQETAEQTLEAARVAREQTLFRISRTTVRAPFDGKIVERLQQPGGYTATGQDVVRLVDIDDIEVRAQAPLSVEPFLEEGMEVVVTGRNREVSGTIHKVVRVGDERSRMFEVRVLPGGDGWVVGSAIRVALPSSSPRSVIAVPRDALVLRSDAVYVFRVNDDGTAERLVIETGIGDSALIEVVGDIKAGDKIVIRGGERLTSGQPVAISNS